MKNLKGLESIIVTGCGGDIGLGLGKILRSALPQARLIGCDIHSDHLGAKIYDQVELLQRADEAGYVESLEKIIQKNNAQVVIPTSESEIRRLLQLGLNGKIGKTPVLLANNKALEVGLDKVATANFLKSHGLPYPWTVIAGEGRPMKFPCILKKRFGAGSRGLTVVEEELESYYANRRAGDIFQEYLYPDSEEYTCGLFRSKSGETRSITFKRRLGGGFTVAGQVLRIESVEKLLGEIARHLELVGSINVQLRLTKNGPVVFEINPRFSSTVVFRHLLGFKDLLWALEDLATACVSPYTNPPEPGIRFYRSWEEVIVAKE